MRSLLDFRFFFTVLCLGLFSLYALSISSCSDASAENLPPFLEVREP